jgi:hypothetical protein
MRATSPSFFKQLSNLIWPDVDNRVSGKEYLCSKHKLTAPQADAELNGLMDMEAALLCSFYGQGLRGDDLRALKAEYEKQQKSFLKLNTDLLYPTASLDPYFKRILSHFMSANISPKDALRIVLGVAEQKPENVKDRIAYLATHHEMSTLQAFKILQNFSENAAKTFTYLVQENHFDPADARAKITNKTDLELAELRVIESRVNHI